MSTSYTPFLPVPLLNVVQSKAFIPFQLAMTDAGSVSTASLVATKHQQHADLLTLPADATIAQALEFFKRYDITAVPLTVNPSQQTTDKAVRFQPSRYESINPAIAPSSIVALLGVHDIVKAIVCSPPFSDQQIDQTILSDAEMAALPIWNQAVGSIATANDSNRHEWFLSSKNIVRDAARSLSAGFRHVLVHEVSNNQSNIQSNKGTTPVSVTIVSAGDLMRFCFTSIPPSDGDTSGMPSALITLLETPIGEHLTPRTKLVTFHQSDLTYKAFQTLSEGVANKSLGAIPIISKSGFVMDNLSASDIRSINQANARHLLMTLHDFLPSLKSRPPSPSSRKSPTPAAQGSPTSEKSAASLRPPFAASISVEATVRMTLEKITVLGISRLWVVDEYARPINVVSLSDIFRVLSKVEMKET